MRETNTQGIRQNRDAALARRFLSKLWNLFLR